MGLKSLSQIRNGDSSSSTPSTGGLKSLSDIRSNRTAQQGQDMERNYSNMIQDESSYVTPPTPPLTTATPQQSDDNLQYANLMKQAYSSNPASFPQSDSRSPLEKGLDYVFKENPVARVLNYPFAKAAEDSIPNAPMIGTRPDGSYGELDGTNARQRYTALNPVLSTGNQTLDKVGDFLGSVGAFFTPIGGPGSGAQNVASDIANRLGATKLGMKAEEALGNMGAAAANKINPYLVGQGIQLSPNLASKVAQASGKGALDFGIANPLYTAQTEDPTLSNLSQSALEGAVGGAALGGAFGAAGSGLEKLASKYAGSKLGDLMGMNKDVTLDQAIRPTETMQDGLQHTTPLDTTSDGLKSLSDIKSQPAPDGARLQSLSELEKSNPDEVMNADVQPQPRLRDKVVEYMDKQAEAAQQRIESRRNMGFVAPKGNDAVDYAIIGAAHIVKDGVRYADFSEMMLNHYGNQIKPYIPGIYKSSVELAKKNGRMTKKDIRRSFNHDQFNKNNLDSTIPDTRGQIVSKTKKQPIDIGRTADSAYIKNVDNLHSMNLLGKAAEKLTKEKLSPEDNPHTLALNTRSNDMIAHQIVNEHLVDAKGNIIHLNDAEGNVIGSSLKDITKQIPKKQYNEFLDYLVNKHAVDRMNRGEKVFDDSLKMSPEKSEEIARRYEGKYPEFKKIADQYHDFMNKLGQSWLVDTGRIPQEVWDAYRKESPDYVPNFREMSDLEKRNNFGSGKQSFSGQGSGVQEAKGSGRKIIDPIESTIELISKNVKGAKKNEVMQALSRVLEKKPDELKGFAENVKEPEGQKRLTKEEMLQKLHDEGLEGFLKNEDDALQTATSKPDLTKGNVVPFMKDGVAQHIKVNDIHLLDAISNMDPKSQGVVIEALGKMTKVMKTLTTGINPIFSFTRNIFRDIPDSFKNSTTTNNPITFSVDLVHAAISAFGDGELAQSYKAMGGGHAGHVSANRNLLTQSKNNIMAHEGAKNTLKYVAQKAWHNFENFNSALETAPRLGEYKRTVKQGGNTYESRVQGIANANDISVNFNRFGTVSKELDKVIPYYNAAIQGLDKTIRSYKDNPVQATIKSVAAITLPTIALYYINHNDPNYQKLSEYTKDNYFLFPKGDGTFYKIPKPREAGFIFGTMVEQMLRLWKYHDPTAFKNFGEYTKSVWAPPGISGMIDTQNKAIDPMGPLKDSIAGPLVGVLANKDFMDRPIVPKSLQGLSPDMQYNQNTSEVGKLLAKLPLNNLSPMQIDYLLKSYGGGVAQFGLPMATNGKTVGSKLTQQITADPTYSNDISTDFYNSKTQYDQQKADAKAQGKVSSTIGTDAFLDKMATVVSQIQKQIKTIQSNPSMSDAVKQDKINTLQIQMNNMQQQALKQIKTAK